MQAILTLALAVGALAVPSAAQNVHFQEDFESGFGRWTMTGLWNAQSDAEACSAPATPFPSGSNCVWFGSPTSCSIAFGALDHQHLTCTEAIVLPATSDVLELSFRSFSQAEDDEVWDTRKVQISADDGATWSTIVTVLSAPNWLHERYDVSRFAGQTVRLRFEFWIGDNTKNNGLGWLLDDIRITEKAGPAVELCYGDGTWIACPCGNNGGPSRGCANSFNPAGARLSASGVASLAADTLQLSADGMSPVGATIIQGTGVQHGYVWHLAGDGLACIKPPYVRIRSIPAPGGALSYPGAGDASISVRGNITQPSTTRTYMVRYRNAAAFCTEHTFNVTNTVQLTWRP